MNDTVTSSQCTDIAGHGVSGAARPDGAGQALRARMTAASVRLIARSTPFLEKEMLGLSQLVAPGDVCVDVGSAAGLYTLALSRLAGPTGAVHSVEPLSFAHLAWTRVLRSRGARNVSHHAVALGTEPGSELMSVPLGRYGPVTGRSFLASRTHGLGSNAEFAEHIAVAVDVTTLDELSARERLTRLDFVKIDVEGAELRVLEGGSDTIEAFRPAMLVEIEARHTTRYRYTPGDIVDWLTRRGYRLYTWRQGWRETDRVREDVRNYLATTRPPR